MGEDWVTQEGSVAELNCGCESSIREVESYVGGIVGVSFRDAIMLYYCFLDFYMNRIVINYC